VVTDENEKQFKVKKTLKEGYFMNADTPEVIKYAKIEVYVTEN